MSTQAITPNVVVQSMKGKYDKRHENGANLRSDNPDLSPNVISTRTGKKSYALRELGHMRKHMSPHKLFMLVLESKSYALAWQIWCDVENRAHGRPYQAINPAESTRHADQDVTKLAVAIQNLNIIQAPKPSKPRKQLGAQVIEADSAMGGAGQSAEHEQSADPGPGADLDTIQAAEKPGGLR